MQRVFFTLIVSSDDVQGGPSPYYILYPDPQIPTAAHPSPHFAPLLSSALMQTFYFIKALKRIFTTKVQYLRWARTLGLVWVINANSAIF